MALNKRKTFLAGVLASALFLAVCPALPRADTGRGIAAGRTVPRAVLMDRNQYAVVIGIDEYRYWPPLECAVADARKVERFLRDLKYEVVTLRNGEATRSGILNLLGRLGGRSIHRLLFFFAGHGHTLSDNGAQRGYIIPADGRRSDCRQNAISLEYLKERVMQLNATHSLLVFDSCYSGLALLRSGGSDESLPGYLAEVDRMQSIQVLTAGRKGDQAMERDGHGVFTSCFLKAVSGHADANGDGILTATEINSWVRPLVYEESRRGQLPMYGRLIGEGEYLFVNNRERVRSVERQARKIWLDHAVGIFQSIENRSGVRQLRFGRSDPLFERILELVEPGAGMDVKSFILNTMNYGVMPVELNRYRAVQGNRRASVRANEKGVKAYHEYRKTNDTRLLDTSIRHYLQAVGEDRQHAGALSNLSLAYHRKGLNRRAIWASLTAIQNAEKRSTLASSLHNIGMCFDSENRKEKALVFYLAALSLRDKSKRPYGIVRSKILDIFRANPNTATYFSARE